MPITGSRGHILTLSGRSGPEPIRNLWCLGRLLRLFLDLWFTLIDHVVADNVFLDKNLGDGSVYCYEGNLPGGSVTAALRDAVEIRDNQVPYFDNTFRRRLDQTLKKLPELRQPTEAFMERFEQRTGSNFRQSSTQIRLALVAGYVDEGLWGLSSQSHYDVQGGPLVLAARIEAEAGYGEIVFDRNFLEELEKESPGLIDRKTLVRKEVILKGVGSWEIFTLPRSAILLTRPE